jgi:sugar phosphate permease
VTSSLGLARRYRWAVLAVGTAGQASFAAFTIGIAVMLPDVRSEYGLSLAQAGLVLAAASVGTMLGMLPWGIAADRVGERLVVTVGLAAAGVATVAAGATSGFAALGALLAVAGFGGASVSAASGRAVMQWFPREERGFALGIRQAAVPIAGAASALALPRIVAAGGVAWGFAAIGIGALIGAALAAAFLREASLGEDDHAAPGARILRDPRTWLLGGGGALLLVPQIALFGFTVLFLHEQRGLSTSAAGVVFAAAQLLAVTVRIVAGRWSDVIGSRIRPLRVLAVGSSAAVLATAVLVDAPLALLAPTIVAANVLAASWNGLVYTAAAEAAGRRRSGAALGVQQTILFGAGAAAAPLFAVLVNHTGWAWSFAIVALAPALAFVVLGRVAERITA